MSLITPQDIAALEKRPHTDTVYQRICARAAAPVEEALLRELLLEAYVTYTRAHASHVKQLQRSEQLNKYLHLLSDRTLFPDTLGLPDRLDLTLHVLCDSRQRPVVERAAMTLLELEQRHRWLDTEQAQRERLFTSLPKIFQPTIPLLALCLGRDERFAEGFVARLLELEVTRKKTRLGELIEVVDSVEDEALTSRLIALTYENLFHETLEEDKLDMLQRVVRECVEKRMFQRHARWHELIDPILSQNLDHPIALEMLDTLSKELPGEAYARYMMTHVKLCAEQRVILPDTLLDHAGSRGSAQMIRYLYPSTQLHERGLFGRQRLSDYSVRVSAAIEAIKTREGIGELSGTLTLSEGAGGELTVLHAAHGALSLERAPHAREQSAELQPPLLDQQRDPRRIWAWLGLAALVFALTLILFIRCI